VRLVTGIPARGTPPAASLASGEFEEHLLDIGNVISSGGGTTRILEAPRQPRRDQQKAHLFECLVGRGDLDDDVSTITRLGQHLLDTANLALDPAQPPLQIGERGLIEIEALRGLGLGVDGISIAYTRWGIR
jgi:hypothetical protein